MHSGNRAIERAQAMVALECDMAVAGIRSRMAEPGSALCITCGEPIEPERRAALPSARRCVGCQSRAERAAKRGW